MVLSGCGLLFCGNVSQVFCLSLSSCCFPDLGVRVATHFLLHCGRPFSTVSCSGSPSSSLCPLILPSWCLFWGNRAILNAAFRSTSFPFPVARTLLSVGGLHSFFVHAPKTCHYLILRNDQFTLKTVSKSITFIVASNRYPRVSAVFTARWKNEMPINNFALSCFPPIRCIYWV